MFLKKYFLHLEKKNRLGSYEENNRYHSLGPLLPFRLFPPRRVGLVLGGGGAKGGTYRSDPRRWKKIIYRSITL